MALNEDWKPEIEHIKGSDLLKKKKKKVEGLPPHLRLSAMKKAFAHTNEENALEKRAKENEKARKWLKKDAKKSGYTDIALRASMSKGAGVSEEVLDERQKTNQGERRSQESGRSDYSKASIRNKRKFGKAGEPAVFDLPFSGGPSERGKMITQRRTEHKAKRGVKTKGVSEGVGKEIVKGFKRHKDAVEKKKIKNRKAVPYAALAAGHTPKGTSLNEVSSYKEFMKDKEQAKARLEKKISDRKDKDKLFVDIKKKGIKFYDKKGSGRIQGGRKKYD